MAATIVSTFNLNPSIATLTTQATTPIDGELGILKIVSPFGITIYENGGYITNDFSDPDIEVGGINYKTIQLTGSLDSSGDPLAGTYVVYIKWNGITPDSLETLNYIPQIPAWDFTVVEQGGTNPPSMLVTDNTYYGDPLTVSVTRAWDITFPVGTGVPNETGIGPSILVSPLYGVLPYTLSLTSTLLWSIPGGGDFHSYYIYNTLSHTESYTVQMMNLWCQATCKVQAVMNMYQGSANSSQNAMWKDQLTLVMGIPAMIKEAWECGNNAFANQLYAYLEGIVTVSPDCGCGCEEATTAVLITNSPCDCGSADVGSWNAITTLDTDFFTTLTSLNTALGSAYTSAKWRVEKEYEISGVTYQTIHIVGMIVYANEADFSVFPAGKTACFTASTIPYAYRPASTISPLVTIIGDINTFEYASLQFNTNGIGYICIPPSGYTNGNDAYGYGIYMDFTYDIVKA